MNTKKTATTKQTVTTVETSSSSKRKAETQEVVQTTTTKVQKVHPFFTKKPTQPTESSSTLRWTTPLGPYKSCLHAVNLDPKPSTKVAAFDLDGTLIINGKAESWSWWRSFVPESIRKAYEDGFGIVIITNQAGLKVNSQKEGWKKKVEDIASKIPDIPFHVFAATQRDGYRKPMIGMWHELQKIYVSRIDKETSYYVGDAAGRKGDFAGTDRKWAENVGIPFFTPEEYFLQAKPVKYELTGFNVSSLPPNLPQFLPSNTPVISSKQPELVLFVGSPCVGKTTTYKRHFAPAGYVHVNQDTLKTRDRCIKAVDAALEEGKSCVVDNTNRDIRTRAYYVELAQKHSVPIRCFLFTGSAQLAVHNNLYRAFNLPESVSSKEAPREVLPASAIFSFKKDYEEPSLEEGFGEIKRVNFVFEGSEEERRCWSMWLQVEGK